MQPIATDEYTLWLEPEGAVQNALQSSIASFAERGGTPTFLPHVTLLGGIQGDEETLIEHIRRLAAVASSIPVRATTVDTGDRYHFCFYMLCEHTPELVDMHATALLAFGMPQGEGYEPHISLAYGLADDRLRAAFTSEVSPESFDFIATSISLWHARGLPNEWRKVASFPFSLRR